MNRPQCCSQVGGPRFCMCLEAGWPEVVCCLCLFGQVVTSYHLKLDHSSFILHPCKFIIQWYVLYAAVRISKYPINVMHEHKPIYVLAEYFFSVQVCHFQFLFMQIPFMIGNLALAVHILRHSLLIKARSNPDPILHIFNILHFFGNHYCMI